MRQRLPAMSHALASAAVAILTVTALTAPVRAQDGGDLAAAYETIASKTFVDLTHSFGPTSPVWSGFGQATFSAAADPATYEPYTIAQSGFHSTVYTLVGQYGTHIDPPAHFAEGGMTQDQIPVKDMILPLVVFDMTPMLGDDPNHAWSVEDLEAWEAEHGQVPAGAFAALRTDMYRDWDGDPERFKRYPFPAWSLEALQMLFDERHITAIGHEALDTDITESMDSETWLLEKGHWQIEVMANLDKLPATGALIVVSWPKVKDGLGFPARAVAVLP